jgi:phenylacetate-CoA ligase
VTWRFRVAGRTDDMFNVRGVNVFPTAVQRVVAEAADLVSGQFRIVLAGPEPYDRIPVRAEAAPGLPPERWREAPPSWSAGSVRARASATGPSCPRGAPRTEGKTRLVEREPS